MSQQDQNTRSRIKHEERGQLYVKHARYYAPGDTTSEGFPLPGAKPIRPPKGKKPKGTPAPAKRLEEDPHYRELRRDINRIVRYYRRHAGDDLHGSQT